MNSNRHSFGFVGMTRWDAARSWKEYGSSEQSHVNICSYMLILLICIYIYMLMHLIHGETRQDQSVFLGSSHMAKPPNKWLFLLSYASYACRQLRSVWSVNKTQFISFGSYNEHYLPTVNQSNVTIKYQTHL